MSYYTKDSNDMIKQLVENSEGMLDVLDVCSGVAIEKLISDEKVYDDVNDGYVHYKNFWYVKDGFRDAGVDYETAKAGRYDYNL